MATVELTIAGRPYELACRNGEEPHLRAIAALVDAKALDAARAMGGMSEARQMLFAALLLADELNDSRTALARAQQPPPAPPPPPTPDPAIITRIEQLAGRVDRLSATLDSADAGRLESPPASA